MAPTWLGRVNRPWHSPWPSSAMVNRQASSASASWRCRALSSWASAISGATTSRTRCASRRSATGSCSAWPADQVCLGVAAVLDRQRVHTLDDHHGLFFGHLPGGHRVPDRFVVVVQGVGEVQAALGVPFGLPGRRWPSSCSCRRRRPSAPRSRRSAWRATRSSSSVTRLRSAPREVRESASSGPVRDQQPTSARWSSSVWIRGDSGRDRVRPGSSNTVAIQGILASGTDTPGPRMRHFRHRWRSISKVSGAAMSVVSTSSTSGGTTESSRGLDTRSLALAARPPELRRGLDTPRWRSLLDHRRSPPACDAWGL